MIMISIIIIQINVPQLSSSVPLTQSTVPSHFHKDKMHLPSGHLNSCVPQAGNKRNEDCYTHATQRNATPLDNRTAYACYMQIVSLWTTMKRRQPRHVYRQLEENNFGYKITIGI